MIELLVDRNRGGTLHDQWHQQEGSVIPVAVYIHAVDLELSYQPGFTGWLLVDAQQIDDLRTKTLEELPFYKKPVDT